MQCLPFGVPNLELGFQVYGEDQRQSYLLRANGTAFALPRKKQNIVRCLSEFQDRLYRAELLLALVFHQEADHQELREPQTRRSVLSLLFCVSARGPAIVVPSMS